MTDIIGAVRLTEADQLRLSDLCRSCSAFFELIEGQPATDATAAEILGPLESRYAEGTKHVWGFETDGKLTAVVERGKFIALDATTEREAIAQVQGRFQARREAVASLGKELGVLRRAHGLTQEQVALALGTKKSNVSRLESGQYGGITIEYFMAVLDAFRVLGAGATRARARRGEVVPIKKAPSNQKALHPTRPSRALASRG